MVSLPAPCPRVCLPSLGALPCPLACVVLGVPCPSLALVLPLPGVVVVGGAGWGGGAGGPGLGVGGLEPPAEGLGGVGGAEALDRIAEEGLPCRLRHVGLRGGLIGVCGGAGAHLLEGMHRVHPSVSSRSPGPFHPAAELLQSGGRPPGEVGGGPGGGGVRAWGPGAAGGRCGPAVVAGVAVPGGAGAAAAGAGGAVKPRIGNRCTASGDLYIRTSGINRVLFSYCFRQVLRFRSDIHCFGSWRLARDFTVTASLTVINGNFNAIRDEGSKVFRNCIDASAIFTFYTRNFNPNFSGCRNRIFDFDILALDLTSFDWTYVLPYARINFPFILPSICLRDMGKTKLIREATCEGHISCCVRGMTIRKPWDVFTILPT